MDLEKKQYSLAYCAGLSVITPPMLGVNLSALYKTRQRLPIVKGTISMFPYQFALRAGQLAIATELKDRTHPLIAFSAIGVFQGIIYGHVNQHWANYLPIRSQPNLMRGIFWAASRDTISQGFPFIAHDWGFVPVMGVSLVSILASQSLHNFQTIMQIDKRHSYVSSIWEGWRMHGSKIFYTGYSSRVAMMTLVNILNYVFLSEIWE